MDNLQIKHLFDMTVDVGKALKLGRTPAGRRHVVSVRGGAFEGFRIRGRVLPGASGDWLITRQDNAVQLNARLSLETDDRQLILMSYRGIRCGPPDVMDQLDQGGDVDPSRYYFRITPYFETGAAQYQWLNQVVSIASGQRMPSVVRYRVYCVL